ncbi:MAG: hypothetical protein IT458_14005 [Planctomycetes bacterium]|nr:hypothetical protein [Planctomycetota bacterium]
MIELFAELRRPSVRVVAHRERPDAEVEVLATNTLVGVECCELLLPEDGRDRGLESMARRGLEDLCRGTLGPAGEVFVLMESRPKDADQVRRWLAAFQVWLLQNRGRIRAVGKMSHCVFPNDLDVAFAGAKVALLGNEHQAELAQARDLCWLYVMDLRVMPGREPGWRVFDFPGTERLADRHGSDLDQLILDTVASKIGKAAGYDFDGQLWLLLRSPALARPTPDLRRRIAELQGIERFSEVWLLDVPANIVDVTRPPTLHALYP